MGGLSGEHSSFYEDGQINLHFVDWPMKLYMNVIINE